MNIPANSLKRHVGPMADELRAAASKVIESGHFILGPYLSQFESAFASYCQASHCVGVANGTDALELGLRAIGIGKHSRVGVISNAAMYGTSAVLACGAEPIFVDIDSATQLISTCALEQVAGDTPLDAVIVTHLYGQLADMPTISALASRFDFKVFEDCAQAHGAEDQHGRKAGSFGIASSFSFYPTKNLGALGDGGAVVTSDASVAERVRQLRQYGWTARYQNELEGGRNSRLDEIQAAMLLAMLPKLDQWNDRRREIIQRYVTRIEHPHIRLPTYPGKDNVGHLFVIQTPRREDLRKHLESRGVGSDIHYPTPDHMQPILRSRYANLRLPATEEASRQVVTLPCFPAMTDAEVDVVITACNEWH
jgi:dTDP-4-amino-4,6-dideoxygalactose transaminase